MTDPRIRSAVIVDPGIVGTLSDDSLTGIDIPMLVINLGERGTVPVGVDARHAAALIPQAQYLLVPDATHFSFLAQCKPAGPRILENEGEPDPLCEDAGGQSRAEIHAALADIIVGALRDAL